MRARWYDPQTAAFLTSDPIGHASGESNLYRYSAGDPTNLIDPSGLILGIPGTPSAQDISNFAAGMGDTTSLGITSRIRQGLGIDNVDYCSSAYGAGGWTVIGVEVALGGAGLAKEVGRTGIRRLGRAVSDETGGRNVFRNLGSLEARKHETVAAVIRSRGGGAKQVNVLPTGYGEKTLEEISLLVRQGDDGARQALKMIKQAGSQGLKGRAASDESCTAGAGHGLWRALIGSGPCGTARILRAA